MELTLFYLPGCPYCRRAEQIITRLLQEHPDYAAVPLRRVNELTARAEAQSRDYWYVPSLFLGDRKLYEADPAESAQQMEAHIDAAFRAALGTA